MGKIKKCPIEDRHENSAKTVERCCLCDKKIGKSFMERVRDNVDKVPKETQQKFIDLLHNGKTVGEAAKIVGIKDTLVSGEIIMQNIGEIHYLRKEVK